MQFSKDFERNFKIFIILIKNYKKYLFLNKKLTFFNLQKIKKQRASI